MVPNLVSWFTFIYNLNYIHVHVKKIEPYCGAFTNMKCLDFLPTCSHKHVELIAIKKEPFLDTSNN
jgi:hypothetical protein